MHRALGEAKDSMNVSRQLFGQAKGKTMQNKTTKLVVG